MHGFENRVRVLIRLLPGVVPTLLATASLWFFWAFYSVAFSRIGYPFELEWMEGLMVEHLLRVIDGSPLYVPPSPDFVPLLYTPLYYVAGAAVSLLTGPGLLPLRIVSLVSISGTFLLLGLIARRETGSLTAGLLAPGLFAATYVLGGAWFDIARVDSLLLLWLFGLLYLVRFHPSPAGLVLAGIVGCLAIMTKQSSAPVVGAAGLYAAWRNPRASLWYWGTAFVATVVPFLAIDRLHDGWFRWFAVTLPSASTLLPERYWAFWQKDILGLTVPAVLLAAAFLAVPDDSGRRSPRLLYGLFLAAMIATSYSSRLKGGGYVNTLIPAYATLCLLASLAWHQLTVRLAGHSGARAVIHGAVIIQFLVLIYTPADFIPNERDVTAGQALVATIASFDGDVLLPFHSYIGRLAGKPSHAHRQAVTDVLKGPDRAVAQALEAEIRKALRQRRYAAVILDEGWQFEETLTRYYRRRGPAFETPVQKTTRAGWRTRPISLFVPTERMAGDE